MLNEENETEANELRDSAPGEARWLITMLPVRLFDDQAEELALALGRPVDEVGASASGAVAVDEDLPYSV